MPQSWQAFWAMGGYAPYVWSSYGIAGVVLLANVLAPMIAHRLVKRRIRSEGFDD